LDSNINTGGNGTAPTRVLEFSGVSMQAFKIKANMLKINILLDFIWDLAF
jgi:hypothetical protein